MSSSFKKRWFEKDIILQSVRWYVAYPLSYRQIEEMMLERGIKVDHSTINRWVVKYSPELEKKFRKIKHPVGSSWRVDETYLKIKGKWRYLYRAVDKSGATVDFLVTARRDRKAAKRFFEKAIGTSGRPQKINIDKSGANKAAVDALNNDMKAKGLPEIEVRQVKYLNNIIEQDHRAVKRVVRPMLGFKSFRSAEKTIAGIELMHMIRKNQMANPYGQSSAELFYGLAS
jgi:putative transposase